MSEIRYDRLHDRHVIIAPERLRRPDCHTEVSQKPTTTHPCPFCEGHESMTPPEIFALREEGSLPNTPHWRTRVVPNLYKAVQIEAPCEHHFGLFEHWDGFGAHEVIIDTPKHRTSMTEWSESEAADWLRTLRERVADLRRDGRIAYINLFKNEGAQAGATQTHSHTQLIGLPVIPKEERTAYMRSFEHLKAHGCSLMETVIEHESKQGERIVAVSNGFTAYCPYASAYPFEVVLTNAQLREQIDTLGDTTIEALVPLLLKTLKTMRRQLGCFDFNLIVSTPPLQAQDMPYELLESVAESCRFYLRIIPRLYRQGGFEAATGIMINPVTPEAAAKLLREGADA